MDGPEYFIGIDPGASGAVAVIHGQSVLGVWKNAEPVETLQAFLNDLIVGSFKVECWIEQVSAMPGQGVSSTFKFGRSLGTLEGAIAVIGYRRRYVTPNKWQRALGCLTGGKKEVSRRKAFELFPGHRWTNVTADAVLIAEYGRRENATVPKTAAG